jgi:K+-sensing histidine kinase KdpD
VTPETLLERLRAGKVYPEARIDAALNGFFRIENLTALRESALRQLTSVLGAHMVVVDSDDLVTAAADEIGDRGTTYVFVGESPPRHGLERLREPLPQRLMLAAPRGVDVRIVAARREK